MSGTIDALTGKAQKKAQAAQQLQAQQTAVSQARQLSEQASQTAKTGLSRRNPRGRRLFADAAAASLPATVS